MTVIVSISGLVRRIDVVRRRAGHRRTRAVGLAAAAALAAMLAASGCGAGRSTRSASTAANGAGPLHAVGAQCPAGDPAGRGAVAGAGPYGPAPRAPFLVDPNSQPAIAARQDAANGASAAAIAAKPIAFSVGDWLRDGVQAEVAARSAQAERAGATAVFMVYAIPHRDVGAGFSAGGEPDAATYRAFTRQVAAGIGARAAVVILEPDSLAQMDSLPAAQQRERYQLLNDAVDVYGGLARTSVYLDGANCGWTAAPVIADRLSQAGVRRTRGFAVNVSNYYRTGDEIARAEVIAALIGGAHFVVDTSRNGRGPTDGNIRDPWCNPPGRGLGAAPTTDTASPRADALLWIKVPGASDGECGRENPPAGVWWPAEADELVRNAES
ncbi:glycoside hydrolase family 6 protein [Frankia sp. Cj3]|uniref:glycoside hydrolase family 6 protein n=1 Tax=Frankia sp. Cj3 TaxID=2880976 RepID=UPI001EF701D4|nr:glycoside hydrolase family 6 protein [Frankia sp. Cj3]